jgi:hypothetical protein
MLKIISLVTMNYERIFKQPIDRVAFAVIFVLTFAIVIFAWGGETIFVSLPKVKSFSWAGKQISAEDTSFIVTFDRPMEHQSVEDNLKIAPDLDGKISWVGNRMAFTLKSPAPYGEKYQISLNNAKERFRGKDRLGASIEPFQSDFTTRDRAFAYIGTQEEERGRLIVYNLTQGTQEILTPPNLVVTDFEFYQQGDKILFSAADRSAGDEILRRLELYTANIPQSSIAIGNKQNKSENYQIKLILDNKDYQNNKFDLAKDGKTIVVQRINRKNPADFDLWSIVEGQPPKQLNNREAGDFAIAPDSQTLAVAQGQGIALLPLQTNAKVLDFLPKFGRVIGFTRDGSAAAMVNFNTDNPQLRYSKSLYYVNNQGTQKKLIDVNGSIVSCQFNPTGTQLFCLLTQAEETDEYIEKPYFANIDINNGKIQPLVALPKYQDIKLSLSSDGLGILFDQVVTATNDAPNNLLRTNSGESIVGGNLWILLVSTTDSESKVSPQLKEIPLAGFHPQWLP